MLLGISAYVVMIVVVLIGIHLAGEWTPVERWWFAKRRFRRLWCSLRDHPYPKITPERDYTEPMILWAPPSCSNCGKEFIPRRRGMHS